MGRLDVLNCGEGHLEVRFEANDPIETARAERIIQDMLRRGYALFVHGTDETLIRVKEFDAKKGVYIIADGPTIPPEAVPMEPEPVSVPLVPRPRGRPRKMAVPIAKARATVVGRSAGG